VNDDETLGRAVEALLLCPEVDPADYRNYALCMAAKRGHVDVVARLLQDVRVNPSDEQHRALRLACKEGCVDVVQRLMQTGKVDPSCKSDVCMDYAVEHAIATGDHSLVVTLLTDDRASITNAQVIRLYECDWGAWSSDEDGDI